MVERCDEEGRESSSVLFRVSYGLKKKKKSEEMV